VASVMDSFQQSS